jgi:hypothetical protein
MILSRQALRPFRGLKPFLFVLWTAKFVWLGAIRGNIILIILLVLGEGRLGRHNLILKPIFDPAVDDQFRASRQYYILVVDPIECSLSCISAMADMAVHSLKNVKAEATSTFLNVGHLLLFNSIFYFEF